MTWLQAVTITPPPDTRAACRSCTHTSHHSVQGLLEDQARWGG
jgi:hypothetical protein